MNCAMNNSLSVARIGLTLQHGQVLSLRKVNGLGIECTQGSVWITFENDKWDHVLQPGERLQLGCGGRLVIEALEASQITLLRLDAKPRCHGNALMRSGYVRNLIASLLSPCLRVELPL